MAVVACPAQRSRSASVMVMIAATGTPRWVPRAGSPSTRSQSFSSASWLRCAWLRGSLTCGSAACSVPAPGAANFANSASSLARQLGVRVPEIPDIKSTPWRPRFRPRRRARSAASVRFPSGFRCANDRCRPSPTLPGSRSRRTRPTISRRAPPPRRERRPGSSRGSGR